MSFPHNLRSISRIVVFVVILVGFYLIFRRGIPGRGDVSRALGFKSVNQHLAMAKELESKGQIEGAKTQLAFALEFDSKNPKTLSFLDEIGTKSQSIDLEIVQLEKIVNLRPDYVQAWEKLAGLYEYRG